MCYTQRYFCYITEQAKWECQLLSTGWHWYLTKAIMEWMLLVGQLTTLLTLFSSWSIFSMKNKFVWLYIRKFQLHPLNSPSKISDRFETQKCTNRIFTLRWLLIIRLCYLINVIDLRQFRSIMADKDVTRAINSCMWCYSPSCFSIDVWFVVEFLMDVYLY